MDISDFHKACSLIRHGKFDVLNDLLNQPDWTLPIDHKDDQGNTLLHISSQNGNKRMVKLCLRFGADVDIKNNIGQTPLHFAFGYGYSELGEYLIDKGADDSLRNVYGLTCYEGLREDSLEKL